MNLPYDDTAKGTPLASILTDLKAGKTVPCYLLYGDEEFRIQDAVEKITSALIPDDRDRELNLFAMDGAHEDVDTICESLITPPLLPGRKVLIIRETRLFQSKNLLTPLINQIQEHLEHNPARAAASFMQFLAITELQLDDLREGGWRKIDDDTWQKIVPDEEGKGREAWLPKAIDLCVSRGLMQTKKRSEETDRLEGVLTGGMPEGNHLIMTAETVDRRKKIFKTVSNVGKILSFVKITGSGWQKEKERKQAVQQLSSKLLHEAGKKISDEAWIAIGKKTGYDLRESMAAIEKLITYVGEEMVIKPEDVEAVIGRTQEERGYELTGAMAERDLRKALKSLHELFDQGEPEQKIFSMVAKHIRILIRAKLLIASGQLDSFKPGMNFPRFQNVVYPTITKVAGEYGPEGIALLAANKPYPVYLALMNAGHFSQNELIGYLEKLLEIDLALKTTGKNPRIMLERLMIDVCAVKQREKPSPKER